MLYSFAMNRETPELERSPGDFVFFAIVFIGFVIGMTGLVTTSLGIGIVGFIMMVLGLSYFLLRE